MSRRELLARPSAVRRAEVGPAAVQAVIAEAREVVVAASAAEAAATPLAASSRKS